MGGNGSGNFTRRKDLDISRILEKSIRFVEHALDDTSLPVLSRLECAIRFALKYMPEKSEHTIKLLSLNDSTIQRITAMLNQLEHKSSAIEYECVESNPIPVLDSNTSTSIRLNDANDLLASE